MGSRHVYVVTTTRGSVVGVYADHEAAFAAASAPGIDGARIIQRAEVQGWTDEQLGRWADPGLLRPREVRHG